MMTLAQLIAANKGADSYDTVAKRGGMATSVLHKFSQGKNAEFPPADTVFALARGLQVQPSVVVMAAAQGLGIDMEDQVGGPLLGRALPPEVDDLPEESKRAIIDTARAMVALMLCRTLPDQRSQVIVEVGEGVEVTALAERARTRIGQGVTRAARGARGAQPG
jgi:hypothetical protein